MGGAMKKRITVEEVDNDDLSSLPRHKDESHLSDWLAENLIYGRWDRMTEYVVPKQELVKKNKILDYDAIRRVIKSSMPSNNHKKYLLEVLKEVKEYEKLLKPFETEEEQIVTCLGDLVIKIKDNRVILVPRDSYDYKNRDENQRKNGKLVGFKSCQVVRRGFIN